MGASRPSCVLAAILAVACSPDPVVPAPNDATDENGEPAGNGNNGGADPPPECGWNAEAVGDHCECVGLYDWCDDYPDDCCAYYTNTFAITVISAEYLPYKDANSPWDWDGNVPNWLLEALDLIGYVVPEAATFGEVLEVVDEVAPELLEGTIPPDPFVEFYLDDEFFAASSGRTDTLQPVWNEYVQVKLDGNDKLYLEYLDEDLAFDDLGATLVVGLYDAQHLAGWSYVMPGFGGLFELEFAIEAL